MGLVSIADAPPILVWSIIAFIGAVAGVGGGLLGVGGGLIIIPLLTLTFGPDQHIYQLIGLIAACAIGLSSALNHLRSGAVITPLAWRIIAWSAPCAALGAFASFQIPGRPLRLTFAAMMLGVAILEGRRLTLRLADGRDRKPGREAEGAWIVGIPMGLLSGLLGVGGGIIAVPILAMGLKTPMRRAVATSAVAVLGTVAVAALSTAAISAGVLGTGGHAATASTEAPVPIWLWAITMGLVGAGSAVVGARLTQVIPVRGLKICFLGILLFFAWRMATA